MKTLALSLLASVLLVGCNLDSSTNSSASQQDLVSSDQFADPGVKYLYGDSGWGKYVAKSMYGTRKLALTFDDGPDAVKTPKLLDILKKYDAKATFFMLGEKLTANKALVARVMEEGHQVAAHDWNHTNNNVESITTHRDGLEKTVRKIEEIQTEYDLDQREMYFRYPYGNYGTGSGKYHHFEVLKEIGNKVYGENCLNFVFWDIDTNDWVSSMTPYMIFRNTIAEFDGGEYFARVEYKDDQGKTKYSTRRVSKKSNPLRGGVALYHDIHSRSIDAIELILKYAQENNIEIVPLSEVQEYQYTDSLSCEVTQPTF